MLTANILAIFHYFFLFISNPEKTPEDTLLSVEPGLMIWTVIIFILLLLILKKTAWKPLLTSLSNREQTIKDSIEKAENLRLDAERMLEENKKRLEQAGEESRRIISEGKSYAEKVRNELLNKTNEDTNRMILQAKEEIEREKLSALNELRSEIAALAVKAAEKIIDENLDEKKQKKIIAGFIKQIPGN
jgi:F-type H+-transporting ATPase subunit b